MNTTTLITGASSGIGRELARLFARDKNNLVLVARNQRKLDELAQELRGRHGIKVKVITTDLSAPESAAHIIDRLRRESIHVDVLVNSAGTQVYGLFAKADTEQLLHMIQVNMTSLTYLSKLLLPGMLDRGKGKILNVASTGSFGPGPLNAVYCATKAYVLSFSEAIAAELDGSGVSVTALCPGATNTEFVTRHGLEDVRLFQNMMSAERVAEIGYQALMDNRLVVVAGWSNRLQVRALQVFRPLLQMMSPAVTKRIGTYVMGPAV
jgi:short-subunit dehydrogenase